jgi:hypothetical protein
MDEVKHWLTSKTIIAAAMGIVLNVLTATGIHLPADLVPADIADHITNVASAVFYVIAIFGRATATAKLTG